MSLAQWKRDPGPPQEWHDWVEELFSPSLNLEKEAIMEGVNKETAVKSKIKRISMLDPETVREVYERVHMMSMMNDEMKTTGLKKSLPLEQKITVPASSSPSKSIQQIHFYCFENMHDALTIKLCILLILSLNTSDKFTLWWNGNFFYERKRNWGIFHFVSAIQFSMKLSNAFFS